MPSLVSRRSFIAGLGALAAASSLPGRKTFAPLAAGRPLLAWLGVTNASDYSSGIRFGYAAITWGGNDVQAIKDVSEVGFPGIQLRSPIIKDFGDRPKALQELLKQYHLEMVALSSGDVRIDQGSPADQVALHAHHAEFVRDVGGRYLQVTASPRPKDRKPTADEYKKQAQIITEIGKRSSDVGVPLGLHNHMNGLAESPDEVDRIMNEADPRYVKLELDIAHYLQGGGDPVKAVKQYRGQILFLHFKDVISVPAGEGGRPYKWVELGRGRVDVKGVLAALKETGFGGWAVVELDSVPDKTRTPKDCAIINKKYVEETLGMKV
jgi:inosose dehydratase